MNRSIRLDPHLTNLLNTAYTRVLSRIKTHAVSSGEGRSLVVRMTSEF